MRNKTRTNIHKLILAVKKKTQWTQCELAAAIGVSQPQISKMINGEIKSTNEHTLEALNKLFVRHCCRAG